MSEDDVQVRVLDEARLHGWRVAHFRPARVMRGGREVYETPVAAEARGYPDLTLVHPRRGLVAWLECKGERGRLRRDQQAWLDDLIEVSERRRCVLACVVDPSNLETICTLLRHGWDA